MSMKSLLSQRGQQCIKELPMLVHAHFTAKQDLFDKQSNPQGYLNFGTAENDLLAPLMTEVVNQMMFTATPDDLHYQEFHGSAAFRQAIARYWTPVLLGAQVSSPLQAENIVVACGCSLVLEMLAMALCDPGEVILIPRPFYPGFIHDLQHRAGVLPVGVDCGTGLDVEGFEAALLAQKKQGKRVKAVLFSSPHNPTGRVYARAEIEGLLDFCQRHDLDLIADEIYAQTIYAPGIEWVSALQVAPKAYRHRVHIASGFAKDFALSGFKVGFAHSLNPYVVKAMQEMSYFSPVASYIQALLTQFLTSSRLTTTIQQANAQLYVTSSRLLAILEKARISVQPPQGGIFLWCDGRSWLKESSFDAEQALWHHFFHDLKISISPGQIFDCPTPGFFRLCFAQHEDCIEELAKRLQR